MPKDWAPETPVTVGITLGGVLIGGSAMWLFTKDLASMFAGAALGLGIGVLAAAREFRRISVGQTNLRSGGEGNGIQGVVAGALIVAYMLGLAGAWYRANASGTIADGSAEKEWLEVFKTGYTLLGGALTTVVGYFFGNRNVDKVSSAINKADQISQDAKQTASAAVDLVEQKANQGSSSPPTGPSLSAIPPTPAP